MARSTRGPSALLALHHLAKNRVGGKPALRQWAEMLGLFLLHGNGPTYYQMAGFWQNGCGWSTMAGHLSFRQYQMQIDELNHPLYRKLSQNKLAEKALFTLMGIPTPRVIGWLDREWGCDTSGSPLRGGADLARVVLRHDVGRLCFKLVEGHGGEGFVAADVLRDGPEPRFRPLTPVGQDPKTDAVYGPADFVAWLGDQPRIVEEYLQQHPVFAALNPSTVNSMRIWVLRRARAVSSRLAYLRIGRATSIVDSVYRGGIAAPIDIRTGRLTKALDGLATRRRFAVHPDHGAPIEGVSLPMFCEAKALAERCLTVFPRLHFAGMDVAMTPTGPAILESNVRPSRVGGAFVDVPTRDVFAPEATSA